MLVQFAERGFLLLELGVLKTAGVLAGTLPRLVLLVAEIVIFLWGEVRTKRPEEILVRYTTVVVAIEPREELVVG